MGNTAFFSFLLTPAPRMGMLMLAVLSFKKTKQSFPSLAASIQVLQNPGRSCAFERLLSFQAGPVLLLDRVRQSMLGRSHLLREEKSRALGPPQ